MVTESKFYNLLTSVIAPTAWFPCTECGCVAVIFHVIICRVFSRHQAERVPSRAPIAAWVQRRQDLPAVTEGDLTVVRPL